MKIFTTNFNFYLTIKRLFFLALLLSFFNMNAQTTYVVDNNQGAGAQFTSVDAAIAAATAGDIIYVQPSPNSYGSITITKQITLYGIGYNPELNTGQHATLETISFNGTTSGTKISGFHLNNIFFSGTGVHLNTIITNNRFTGLVEGATNTSDANNVVIQGNSFYTTGGQLSIDVISSQNWVISNNIVQQQIAGYNWRSFSRFNSSTVFNNNIIKTIQNGDANGSIIIFKNCTGALISNNIFLFTGTGVTNMNGGANSSLNFQNNLTYSYNTTLDILSGTNNIDNTDPLFVSFAQNNNLNNTTNDFHFQAASSAKAAGTDGFDLGVYNGGFPFNLRGYPTALPYLTDFIIYNTNISAGASLNINVKANANIN
jgi:hypothetical protein